MSHTGGLHETCNDLNLIGSDDMEFVREPCPNFNASYCPTVATSRLWIRR